jgi:hypothetical protein
VRSCGLSSVRCNDPRAPRLAGGGERGLNHPRNPREQGDVVAVATGRGFMGEQGCSAADPGQRSTTNLAGLF